MFHAWPLLLIFAGRLRERRIARKGLLEFHSHLASGVCRRIRLCGSQCDLCASVVSVFFSNSTTETPRITELAQRNSFSRQTLKRGDNRRDPKSSSRFNGSRIRNC